MVFHPSVSLSCCSFRSLVYSSSIKCQHFVILFCFFRLSRQMSTTNLMFLSPVVSRLSSAPYAALLRFGLVLRRIDQCAYVCVANKEIGVIY